MKIGTLIATVIILIGVIIQTMALILTFNAELSWTVYEDYVSIGGSRWDLLPFLGYVVYYFGLMFAFLTAITAPKILLKIGGILCVLGSLGMLALWMAGIVYNTNITIFANILFILCVVMYFVGLILHRKYNLIAMISGILVLIATLGSGLFAIFIGINYYFISDPLYTGRIQSFIYIHLFAQLGLGVIFFIHNLIFSFSKKKKWMDDGAEDTLSVEKGAAFASYVPKDTKTKKPAKGTKDQEVVFKF